MQSFFEHLSKKSNNFDNDHVLHVASSLGNMYYSLKDETFKHQHAKLIADFVRVVAQQERDFTKQNENIYFLKKKAADTVMLVGIYSLLEKCKE